MITAVLMAACCSVTYFCVYRFSLYIYSHDLYEVDELIPYFAEDISYFTREEAQYVLSDICYGYAEEFDYEFVFHIFQSSGEEISLSDIDKLTGKKITQWNRKDTTQWSRFTFKGDTEEYTLFAAKNTDKESQIVEALEKSIPVLSIIILSVSVIAAFFYTYYMTKPVKRISKLSKQMADMDFSGFCPTGRTDEIGILSDSLNELSEKLSKALSELESANKKLQADIDRERQLERQRIEFFSAASHELKTPITIIKGQLQGMLYKVGRYKDRDTYLEASLGVTDTLEKMVRELLTISRLDTPGYTCNKCDIDFSKFINDRLLAYEDLFLQKELTVEKFIYPEVYIMGDIRLLQKAWDNLLGNAAAYSGAGNHIIVKLWKEDEKTNLTIENTGVHIPENDIPRLFEAFYRVDLSRNRQTGGSGLGLYIVKTILDLHGAEIKIGNTPQGVLVKVSF